MAEVAEAVPNLDRNTNNLPQSGLVQDTDRKRIISCYESLNELSVVHRVGQIAAVRWLDDNNTPQWYVVVVVGQTDSGYEVRWKDDIYTVDVNRDECLFNYNQRTYSFFQRFPQATSITIGKDVYLFAFPDEPIHSCVHAVNLLRAQRGEHKVQIEGLGRDMTLEELASLLPDNKIIFAR